MRNCPNLPQAVIGFIHNHARKNFWRVASWYEIEDLIQDGLLCAYKCIDRYGKPGVDIDEPHFMRLVQSTFYNHIGELLRWSRAVDDSTKISDLSSKLQEQDILDRILESEEPEQEFLVLIKELPEQLRKIVELYFSEDGIKKIRKSLRIRFDGNNETMSERLNKLTGFSIDKNFETELRSYLWEREMELI